MNIGERAGDYEIVEILGAGGMGQVYKVRNLLSDRIEAMKVLLPNLEGNPELADRFLREIKVQAALDHPNIAKLHTAMRSGNQLVMVMEFVEGEPLSKMLERGPVPVRSAVSYASQVLAALAYAHARGVIHRDIKPANIMVMRSGAVKLMDFGIARMKADRRLTQTGSTVGSLFYMSPEQIKGGEPDPRSDLYSLGITLYEMITGRPPFSGASDFQIMSAHLQETPAAPIEVVPGVPDTLNDVILMAIEKDADRRFQTADAFRQALSNVFPEVPTQTMTQPQPPSPPPQARASTRPLVPQPPPIAPQTAVAAPPPAGQPASRRGLYMALGSALTLAILVAAAVEGPKLMRGGSSGAQSVPGTPPSTPTLPRVEPQQPSPASVPANAGVPASSSSGVHAQAPVTPPPARRPQQTPTVQVSPSSPGPGQLAVPVQEATPVRQQTQTPVATSVPAAAPAPRAVPPELNELRQRFNDLSIRAATARDGIRSIQQQMAGQGLGLRADIREAQTRMDYQLQEATSSIERGDLNGARTSLQYAERAVETLEKFLGR
jgi:serine/threonine protein kinase